MKCFPHLPTLRSDLDGFCFQLACSCSHLSAFHEPRLTLLNTNPHQPRHFVSLHELCACCVSLMCHLFCCPPTCLFTIRCVSVPPHDVKRMAWNSTGNSSCPDSDHSQSSIPAAPLGGNTVAAKSNTKPSKTTSILTNSAFPAF